MREPFPEERESLGSDRAVNPRPTLEVDDEHIRGRGAHDDRLAREGAKAENLWAQASRPRLRAQIRHEALVDRVRSGPLRDDVRIPGHDLRRDIRQGRERRPRGAQKDRAQQEPRECARSDQDRIAPRTRTRTAARREGTKPATTAARIETRSARPTPPVGTERTTKFGSPNNGAKETTALAMTIPSALPTIAPTKARRIACTSYTPATVEGDAPRLRSVAISRARWWTSSDIAAYTRRAMTTPM